ncbi:MAG: carotenoid biosynthesis protein [Candidatus Lokiarchaeota archaeon]|nr:carotenoid biosynthesis protein [Candidatus Lokiarchaeota archaeon]
MVELEKSEIAMICLLAFSAVFFVISRIFTEISSLATIVQVMTFFCFTLIHGTKTLGAKNLVVFIIIAYLFSMLMETLGAFGLFYPFCYWIYANKLGPMFLGKVPYLIPLTWLTFLYCALSMSNIICNRIKTNPDDLGKLDKQQTPILLISSFIGSLIMTAWDLINDPTMVARGYWTWPLGGEFYGIPIGNYVFWIITSFGVFVLFNLYLGLVGKNQVFYKKQDNERSLTTLWMAAPYLMLFIIQSVTALQIGVVYAISWAAIGMGASVVVTIIRFFQLKKSN